MRNFNRQPGHQLGCVPCALRQITILLNLHTIPRSRHYCFPFIDREARGVGWGANPGPMLLSGRAGTQTLDSHCFQEHQLT